MYFFDFNYRKTMVVFEDFVKKSNKFVVQNLLCFFIYLGLNACEVELSVMAR